MSASVVWVILTFFNYGNASTGHQIGPYQSEAQCEQARDELNMRLEDMSNIDNARTVCMWTAKED